MTGPSTREACPCPIPEPGLAVLGGMTRLSAVELGLLTEQAEAPRDGETGQPQNEIEQGINPFLEIDADPVTLGLLLRAMTGTRAC